LAMHAERRRTLRHLNGFSTECILVTWATSVVLENLIFRRTHNTIADAGRERGIIALPGLGLTMSCFLLLVILLFLRVALVLMGAAQCPR
jgi:hypothetical protein